MVVVVDVAAVDGELSAEFFRESSLWFLPDAGGGRGGGVRFREDSSAG